MSTNRLFDPQYLVSHWPLSMDANDVIRGHDGTVNGATRQSESRLNGLGSYYFDGADDYIDIDTNNLVQSMNYFQDSFTWAAWARCEDSFPAAGRAVLAQSYWGYGVPSGDMKGANLVFANGYLNLKFYSATGSQGIYTTAYNYDGQWVFVVAVKDDNEIKLYVNGELKSQATLTITMTTKDGLYIGNHAGATLALASDFLGNIADARIYNVALTSDEIKALYKLTQYAPRQRPLLYIFDSIKDLSQHQDDLTINGAIIGNRILFDGVDDYIQIDSLGKTSPAGLTLAGWINFSTLVAGAVGITSRDASNNSTGFWQLNSSNRMYANFYDAGGSPHSVTGPTAISADQWYFVVATYDNDKARLYVNGNLEGTSTGSGGQVRGLDDVRLMANFSNSSHTHGKLANVGIYDEAKSEDWVREYYERTKRYY